MGGCIVSANLDHQLHPGFADIAENPIDQRKIAILDAFLHQGVGHGDPQLVALDAKRDNSRERGHPHGLGNLLTQSSCARRPQLICLFCLH